MVYARYYVTHTAFSDDLEELVRRSEWAEEKGEQATIGFYRADGDAWVEVDVSDIRSRLREAWHAEYNKPRPQPPWLLWVFGPTERPEVHSAFKTRHEADACAATLPAILQATVTKAGVVPPGKKAALR
jgi:hypothetical protein